MLSPHLLASALKANGFRFITGVPCSYLTSFLNIVATDPELRYIGATNEGDAAAIAAGAWLAGERPVVLMQNSGLGNAVNPLTSLLATAEIPALLIVTRRGTPGHKDEPQHDLMGRITPALLDLLEVDHDDLPEDSSGLIGLFRAANQAIDSRKSFAFVIRPNVLESTDDKPVVGHVRRRNWSSKLAADAVAPSCTRSDILQAVMDLSPAGDSIVATTGKTGRELFTIDDRKGNFYLVGAMGSAAAVGLGIALNTSRRVVVLDGDGSLLMKLGICATIGAHQPSNLVHVVLDNESHDSTGGQPTVSGNVDLCKIALSCGYGSVGESADVADFEKLYARARSVSRPAFIRARIKPGSPSHLGRPTISPSEVAARFRTFLAQPADDFPIEQLICSS